MSDHDDIVRIRHMTDAVQKAVHFCKGRRREDLETDELFTLALIRLLEVIGEAARAVSPDLRQRHPEIPWQQIAGTRDRLIHGYMDVDFDIVWQIITGDLPALMAHLEKILSEGQ